MANTKDFIEIEDVHNDVVILGDGSVSMVLQTSAVNFDLLSETEQLAIIGSFAGLLNSLSFSIQIMIRSKRLDISHYLNTLKEAESKQHNLLLQMMMQRYRAFVTAIIRENEVLDKQFYVVISVSAIELGVVKNNDKNFEKALTILMPRRDHIIKQLGRIGLKSTQLTDEKLTKLFYDIYNDVQPLTLAEQAEDAKMQTAAPEAPAAPTPVPVPVQPAVQPVSAPLPQNAQPIAQPRPQPPITAPAPTPLPQQPQMAKPAQSLVNTQQPAAPQSYQPRRTSSVAPFVVEELKDDYSAM